MRIPPKGTVERERLILIASFGRAVRPSLRSLSAWVDAHPWVDRIGVQIDRWFGWANPWRPTFWIVWFGMVLGAMVAAKIEGYW